LRSALSAGDPYFVGNTIHERVADAGDVFARAVE
jgi:hypothetical protein